MGGDRWEKKVCARKVEQADTPEKKQRRGERKREPEPDTHADSDFNLGDCCGYYQGTNRQRLQLGDIGLLRVCPRRSIQNVACLARPAVISLIWSILERTKKDLYRHIVAQDLLESRWHDPRGTGKKTEGNQLESEK